MKRWHRKSDDTKDKMGDRRLLRAAERGATSEVRKLIDNGTNLVAFGHFGTPLHYAAKNGFNKVL